jgi:choline dehydrogenase
VDVEIAAAMKRPIIGRTQVPSDTIRLMADVVVVGGGAAGCVVAALLAGRGRSVLLLEAGPDRRADLPDELHNGWTIEREPFDWGYKSEPDSVHEPRPVRRKKLLGGTSWLTRFTPRGSPADYDDWARFGVDGWAFRDVLPYFIRLEHDLDYGHEAWHGDSGPLPSVRYLDHEYHPTTKAAIRAVRELGHPWVDDVNRPGAVGVGRMPMNTRDGRRVTTLDAYLADPPTSLGIRANSLVDRVLFDGTCAKGVRLADGTEIEAGAVVLSAGVYGSPPILLRSGIGPQGQLVDLPEVGENLADHPGVLVGLGYSGPAADPVLHVIASFHSSETPIDQAPDLMFWIADPHGEPAEFGIEVLLMKPRSRGYVRLRSADPHDAPLIRLPNLEDPADVPRLMEGYRQALRVAKLPQPGDVELEARIRAEAYSVPHVVGTCALGAVVDAEARVHGTDHLWVVDASIIPDALSGFTHIPTVMLAERLSESLAALI